MPDRIAVREPYVEARQQRDADMMGIYIFLATELMLFGGLFAVAYVIRILHPADYIEASKRLHVWFGAINTAVLLTSSLAVALGAQAARIGRDRRTALCLLAAAALGIAFLAIKAAEYATEYREGLLPIPDAATHFASPVEHQFMNLYLIATALHAVHLTIGILLLAGVAVSLLRRPWQSRNRLMVVTVAGIYWHFVDVVWVFLYPALYLAR
jgi:cytochrome c oxidase subunit III